MLTVVLGSRFISTGFCFVMLHVRALSGAPVAELHVENLKARSSLNNLDWLRVNISVAKTQHLKGRSPGCKTSYNCGWCWLAHYKPKIYKGSDCFRRQCEVSALKQTYLKWLNKQIFKPKPSGNSICRESLFHSLTNTICIGETVKLWGVLLLFL